jgi:hypothetical protein
MKKLISVGVMVFLTGCSPALAGWRGELFCGVLFSGAAVMSSMAANDAENKANRIEYDANKHRSEFARRLDIASYYEGAAYVEQKYNGQSNLWAYYQEQHFLNSDAYQYHNKQYLSLNTMRNSSLTDAGIYRGISYGTAVIGAYFLVKSCFSAAQEAKNKKDKTKNGNIKVIANNLQGLSFKYSY